MCLSVGFWSLYVGFDGNKQKRSRWEGLPVLDVLADNEEVRLDEALDDLTVPLLA